MPEQNLNKKISSFSNFILALAAISFLLFYLALSFYTRPASDDIFFIELFKQKGPVDFISYVYNTWSGRWAPLIYFSAVLNLSDTFQNIHYYVFIYYCLTIVLFIYSVNSILRFITEKIFKTSLRHFSSVTYSVLLMAAFYFFTFQHIEAWWWFCACFAYLQGIVFLLFGAAILLKQNKKIGHYILIALSFIYAGSCSEVYVMIIGSLFIFIIVYTWLKIPGGVKTLRSNLFFKGFVTAFVFFCLSALFCFMAPGNNNRLDKEYIINEEKQITEISSSESKDLVFQKKYAAAIAISSLWFLLGMKLRNNSAQTNIPINNKKAVLFATLPLLLSIVIALFVQFFILKNSDLPLRACTFTSFALSLFMCFVFLLLGFRTKLQNSFSVNSIKIIFPTLVFFALAFNLYEQYKFASNYAKEYDGLVHVLVQKKASGNKDPLLVKKLPDSGMLVYLNLEDKTMREGLKSVLDLDYEIEVER